jgi:adenylate kinase family enzyme
MSCKLLNDLIKDMESNEKIRSVFEDVEDTILRLKKLKNLIGMKTIKKFIAEKIRYYIIEELKEKGKGLEGNKIHFIILGDPGTGKTTVCRIISEIYNSIGFLRREKVKKNKLRNIAELQDEIIRKLEGDKRDKNKIIIELSRILERFNEVDESYLAPLRKSLINSNIENKNSILNNLKELTKLINANLFEFESIKKNYSENLSVKKNFSLNVDPKNDIFGNDAKTNKDETSNFLVLGRADFVGQFVGGTENKIEESLRGGIGGVIFIDEFYSICVDKPGHSDSDGIKILNRINSFIDEYNGRVCFAFGGYLKDVENQIFKKQAGLDSRICDKYIIENYTTEELSLIYIQKMKNYSYEINEDQDLSHIEKLIEENKNMFSGNGRSMETLADTTKSVISNMNYDLLISGKPEIKTFNITYLKEAIKSLATKNI